jgi:magnesium transporter
VLPLRDALYSLKNFNAEGSTHLLDPSNLVYFNRLHQKSLEILDQIEYDSNAAESASNLFFASQTQRMNAIMKTLTIFSVIFMPLTFIVGVYGMNFENMPELQSHNGYFIVLGVMGVTALLMIWYFKKKKWF